MEPTKSGEAGHQGRDRQAPRNTAPTTNAREPGPAHAATPPQAQAQSKEANKKATPVDDPDFVHPGPGRHELEKSKGNLHHQQHEPQPDMQDEVEEL